MKTSLPKKNEIEHKWHIVDATDQILGRLASKVAKVLSGKHKPTFTPFMDMGDFVIITNIDKIKVTGNKTQDKIYKSFSGYPGGLRTLKYHELFEKEPETVVQNAIKGMLPKNKLRQRMMKRLKLYTGDEHKHQAQKPEKLEI